MTKTNVIAENPIADEMGLITFLTLSVSGLAWLCLSFYLVFVWAKYSKKTGVG